MHFNENERRRTDRRQRRVSFVLHERRSGFDRREPGGAGGGLACVLAGLRDRPGTLWVLLVTVNILNLADFFLTLNVLAAGGGEANPILRPLFEASPVYAGLFKFLTVFIVTLIVWRCRRFRRALEAALIMVGVFAVVFLYHILGLVAFF
jgi:hypothetical protein